MRIGVLGTGMVGNTIASRLVRIGHRIMVGSRTSDSDASQTWLRSMGGHAHVGTFTDAAAFGEIVFDCPPAMAGEMNMKASNPARTSTSLGGARTTASSIDAGW